MAEYAKRATVFAGQGVTKGEHELLKEEKQQTWRALDLEILDIKNDTKAVERDVALVNYDSALIGLEIAEIGRQTKEVDLHVAEVNLEAHTLDIDIAQERLTQKQDELSFETFQTRIKRQSYIVQANSAIAQLEAASQELGELLDLNQLKFSDYQPQLLEGF